MMGGNHHSAEVFSFPWDHGLSISQSILRRTVLLSHDIQSKGALVLRTPKRVHSSSYHPQVGWAGLLLYGVERRRHGTVGILAHSPGTARPLSSELAPNNNKNHPFTLFFRPLGTLLSSPLPFVIFSGLSHASCEVSSSASHAVIRSSIISVLLSDRETPPGYCVYE
jgi:hypothetical protein